MLYEYGQHQCALNEPCVCRECADNLKAKIAKLTAEIEHAIETLDADGDEHGVASVLRKCLRDVSA